MTLRAVTLATLCAGLALAGCLTDAPAPDDGRRAADLPPGWVEFALAAADAHDHNDPADHVGRSTPNFKVLGHDPLILEATGRTAGSHWCGDTKEHEGRRISVTHSWRGDAGLVVIDTTEPAAPAVVGELIVPLAHVYDVAITDDQRYALLATSPLDAGPDTLPAWTTRAGPNDNGPVPVWRDACGQVTPLAPLPAGLPYAAGIILVDLADLSQPVVADYRPLPPMGAHSVRAGTVGGTSLVVSSVFGYFAYPLGYAAIMTIKETAAGAVLAPASVYVPPGLPPEPTSGSSTVHDAYIQEHPITGRPLVYLAYGSTGLFILDVTDPTMPVLVGSMTDWSGLGGTNGDRVFAHAALPMDEAWDGRHYTLVGEECPQPRPDTPTCLVVILDTTDPAAPAYIGAWTLPTYTPTWQHSYQFSVHYFAVAKGHLFVSLYHGGVWAADISTPEARVAPSTVGVFLPLLETSAPAGPAPGSALADQVLGTGVMHGAPMVLDLDATSDGDLIVYDAATGLYTVRFDETDRAPPLAPWPIPAPGDRE